MHSRITEIEVLGTKCPLNYSVRASRQIAELPKLTEQSTVQDNYEHALDILFILMAEGVAYRSLTMGDTNLPPFAREQLFTAFTPGEMPAVIETVNRTIELGSQREVQVKPPKKEKPAAPPPAPKGV